MDTISETMSREQARDILNTYVDDKIKMWSAYTFPVWDEIIVYNNENYTFQYLIDIAYGD
jgi:hypothetical protein